MSGHDSQRLMLVGVLLGVLHVWVKHQLQDRNGFDSCLFSILGHFWGVAVGPPPAGAAQSRTGHGRQTIATEQKLHNHRRSPTNSWLH